MSVTGHGALDHAPEVVASWLNEICEDLEWGHTQKGRAYLLLRTVLHTIRDFVGVDEAADLAAQLPVLVRGVFFDGWDPSSTPVAGRSKTAFLARVNAQFSKEPLDDPERAIEAIFDLLRRHVSEGEIEHIRHAMRKPLQEMWYED